MLSLHLLRDTDLTAISPWILAKALSAGLVVFFIASFFIVVKRLYFHPLSKVPGPKLAGATEWYEFYYDVICHGAYSHQYLGFHEKYASSIIRVSPNHVHIKDPDFFNDPRSKFYKPPYFYDGFGAQGSVGTMTDPHKHKIRRNILNPRFSARSVDSMSSRITSIVQRALEIAITDANAGKPTSLQELFGRVTLDAICETIFGHSYNSLEDEEEDSELLANLDMFQMQIWIGIHFPILMRVAMNLPDMMAKKIAPGYMRFRAQCTGWVTDVIERRNRGIFIGKTEDQYAFDLLLEPQPVKNYVVPHTNELVDEAVTLILAGTGTTTYVITNTVYYILSHGDVLKSLQDDLQRKSRENEGRLEWATIRQLPYLTAIVQESLRLSPPGPGGFPRVVPPQGVQFGSHFLPGGTIVSTSIHLIHRDPQHFLDPETFNPDRWLGEKGNDLRKWNVAFSSGTRNCLGINLAYQEIYICLALLFSKFEMELFDTDASSVEWEDYVAARNKRPVKIKVRSILI